MNFKMIRYTLGWILLFEAGFLLVPILTALIYREDTLLAFLWSAGACLAVSMLLMLRRPAETTLRSREGLVTVSLSWIVMSLFGALPFFVSGAIPHFLDALFETVSGFTTTGATILTEIESLPRSILIWRSFTHWIGGMGVLMFLMAFLPLSKGQNIHIMRAESPGPVVSKLVPRVRTTAMTLYLIYIAMSLLQFILLLCGGMSAFEAINATFATAGTGGFGVKNDSIAGYSPYIQIVLTVFMLLFSLNLGSYFLLFKGRAREALNSEFRTFLVIVAGAVTVVTLNIRHMYGGLATTVRHAAFAVSSIVSTTGFATENFDLWPEFSKTVLLMLMFIGACAGSTGGGVKTSRILMLIKGFFMELRTAVYPKRVKKMTIDGRVQEDDVVRSVYVFFVCYAVVFFSSILLIALEGNSFVVNFSSVVTTLGNVGPGLGAIGPAGNFAFFTPLSKAVLIFDMLAGRLEFLPLLVLFAPMTWKK